MERKYYLRGLGIGIAVTAIIMGVSLSGNQAMTDEEIIARAKELGMVENTVLADTEDKDAREADEREQPEAADSPAAGEEDDSGPEVDEDDGSAAAGEEDGSGSETADGEADDARRPETAGDEDAQGAEAPAGSGSAAALGQDEEPAGVDDVEPAAVAQDGAIENVNEGITSAAVKTITISHGDGSYTVARKLADVGVVTSAATFDTFLCQNGYDKRLRTGTFSIPADASDEQIARIVTGAE